jgi:hypothetical protein
MAAMLSPPPMLILKVLALTDNPGTLLLSRRAAFAPGNGAVSPSNAGAVEAPLVELSVYPLPLASA